MKIEEAIKIFEDWAKCNYEPTKQAAQLALTALRSMPKAGEPVECKELTTQLRRMAVETGSLVCLGCGYEHNCGVHGCALLRQAAETIEKQAGAIEELRDHECSGLVEDAE